MPTYKIPSFNVTCDIWKCTTAQNARSTRRQSGVKALLYCSRYLAGEIEIRLPKGTDVRVGLIPPDQYADMIELPSGSGRFYQTFAMDDRGKGFPNEYRVVFAQLVYGSTNTNYPLS